MIKIKWTSQLKEVYSHIERFGDELERRWVDYNGISMTFFNRTSKNKSRLTM